MPVTLIPNFKPFLPGPFPVLASKNIYFCRRVEVIPRFERNLTDLLSYDGDAVEFECHVTGNPEPDIRWFHYTEVSCVISFSNIIVYPIRDNLKQTSEILAMTVVLFYKYFCSGYTSNDPETCRSKRITIT